MDLCSEDIIKLAVALLAGAMIGAEREYRSKSAGFRTLMLISFGSSLFTMLSSKIGQSDEARIAANIVTGIGFLGAGAIFRDDNKVTGLTTAATVWAAAALGMASGSGYYLWAIMGAIFVLFILWGMLPLENFIDRTHRVRNYRIVTAYNQQTLLHYEEIFSALGLQSERGKQSRVDDEIIGCWTVIGADEKHQLLIDQLLADKSIKEFDF
jgi:putative Mg2+ transporter-C (MgtC) family protein